MGILYQQRYDSLYKAYGELTGVPWQLLRAMALVESSQNPNAISKVGAKGLLQFMDATWREWGHGDPYNPEASIEAGAKYIANLIKRFDGDYRMALAAYNGGPTKLARVGYPAMPTETKDYVVKVMRTYGYEGGQT